MNMFQIIRAIALISILSCLVVGFSPEEGKIRPKRDTAISESSCGILESKQYEERTCYEDDVLINCPVSSSPGKILTKYCRLYFRFNGITKTRYKCVNGKWIAIDKPCTPECGVKRASVATRIISGSDAEENEYPWIVAIYNDAEILICSGTILSQFHILSAAHCFSDEKGSLKDTSQYKIIAGKYYTDINRTELFSQTRTIRNVSFHEDYRGNFRKYNDDIAVITLMTEFVFTLEVEPICIDWNSIYEDAHLRNGVSGEIAGWGNIHTSRERSKILHKITVPYRDSEQCSRESPVEFRVNYLVSDKFCAGYLNKGIGICFGDSGGGLYFQTNNKYYIRGIASIVVQSAGTCSSDHYALYTKVSKYLKWMYSIITSLSMDAILIHSGFASDSWIEDGNGCILPEHPLNGSYYLADKDFYIYIPGNLVKQHSLIILRCSSRSSERTRNTFCHKATWYPEIKEDVCKCLEFECDGKVDCEDGSDETEARCANIRCPSSSFRCKYGACISKSKVCDGEKDCADGSDEKECLGSTPASARDGCILPTHLSNGRYSYSEFVHPLGYTESDYVDPSSKITLNCNEGYKLLGPQEFYCSNKKWLPALNNTSCIRIPATPPPKPTTPSRVGEKSRRACKSYEYLGQKVQHDPLGNEIRESICPWKSGAPAIIGGEQTHVGEFPHMALIGYGTFPVNYDWKCGGTLISERFILTAAQCLFTRSLGEAKFVRLGDLNNTDPNDDQHIQQINIKRLHPFPNYTLPVVYNDIALLELEKSVNISLYVKPACLYSKDPKNELQKASVTGWGITENDTPNQYLLKATLDYFTSTECNKIYQHDKRKLPRGIDDDIIICFGSRNNNKDTCQGDSGGPIQVQSSTVHCSYDVFGVTSFGIRCGIVPSGYTKIYSYIEWIESIVWP